jgi:hypothetical protein
MPIELIDKIKQKNNGTFPLVEAQDVEVSKNKRLPEALNEKLSTNELNTAINVALAQAKESGEFDGEQGPEGPQGPKGNDGKDGIDGVNGVDGSTPIKGKDYFTEQDKQEFVENIKSELNEIQTISNPNTTIVLSTNITNIIFTDSDNTNISFSYSGQNECTIVIYNKTGNSITLPTDYKFKNYETVTVNKILSVTLLDDTSCEINIMFTNGECRILTIV